MRKSLSAVRNRYCFALRPPPWREAMAFIHCQRLFLATEGIATLVAIQKKVLAGTASA